MTQKNTQKCKQAHVLTLYGAGCGRSIIDLRRFVLKLLQAAVNGLKTSLHLLSLSLHCVLTPQHSPVLDLPNHQIQVTCENQFQNIPVFTEIVYQSKASISVLGPLGGSEWRISQEELPKLTYDAQSDLNCRWIANTFGMCTCRAKNLDILMLKIFFALHTWNLNQTECPLCLFAKSEEYPL